MYLELDGFEVMVSNCTFLQNSAGNGTYDPLAGHVVGALAVASSTSPVLGQGSGSVLYMVNTTFDSNMGDAAGGLDLQGLQCVALSGNTFVNNSGSLGAVYMQVTGDPNVCAQQAQTSSFAAQLAPYFANLFADTYNIDIRGSNFTNNLRALYLDTLEQPVSVADCVFDANQAVVEPGTGGAGGGLYMIGSYFAFVTITDCSFVRNSSPFLGGAIFILSFSTQHSVTNCVIDSNQAAVSGGGIALVDGSLTVNSSSLLSNSAGTEGGGGITCRDCVRLTVVNSSLGNNSCQEVGGAVKVSGLPASDILLDQVNVSRNR